MFKKLNPRSVIKKYIGKKFPQNSDPHNSFENDGRHVPNKIAAKIMKNFEKLYVQ